MRRHIPGILVSVLLLLCPVFGACSLTKKYGTEPGVQGFERQCEPSALAVSSMLKSQQSAEASTNAVEDLHELPPSARELARVIGVAKWLADIPRTPLAGRPESNQLEAEVRILRRYQRIQNRLMLAMAEVSSTAAVLRCEEARAEELADSLARTETRRTNRLTLASIVLGGITDAVTGALSIVATELVTGLAGIVGGVAETAPGVAALVPQVEYEFMHTPNHLKEIWEGPQRSEIFPEAVWQFLNLPRHGETTLREQLLEKWQERIRLEEGTEELDRMALLLGPGGPYRVSDLRARGAMLQLLGATVELMHDDLQLLIRELWVREGDVAL